MIKKIVKKFSLNELNQSNVNLKYWLSQKPEDRISAVEILRRQYCGNTARLQRVVKIVSRKSC